MKQIVRNNKNKSKNQNSDKYSSYPLNIEIILFLRYTISGLTHFENNLFSMYILV